MCEYKERANALLNGLDIPLAAVLDQNSEVRDYYQNMSRKNTILSAKSFYKTLELYLNQVNQSHQKEFRDLKFRKQLLCKTLDKSDSESDQEGTECC